MNYTNAQCLDTPAEQPPTTNPWCAIPVGTNSSLATSLQSCCNGAPVAIYNNLNGPLNCWQCCNISDSAIRDNQTILNCLTSSAQVIAACGPNSEKIKRYKT